MLLLTRAASAQTSIVQWNFGTSAFSRNASSVNPLISTTPLNISDSVIVTTSQFNTNGNTGYYGQAGSWTNSATNNTNARTALTPRASTKSLNASFTIRPEATGDFSNTTISFKYQRTASSAPTKVRAFLTWQDGTSYFTRYSSSTSLSNTLSTTVWTASPSITFNTGSTAFPSGAALAGKTFLLELEFSSVSNTTNSINIDDIALTANSLCSNVLIASNGALPAGTMRTAYSQSLGVSGGIGTYTWSVVTGKLPPGMTLGTTTGILSGTPTSWGDFSFTVRAVDSVGCLDDSDLTLNLAPATDCVELANWDFSNYANGQTVGSTSSSPIIYSFKDSRVNATGLVSPSSANFSGFASFLNLETGNKSISFTISSPAGSAKSWEMVDLLFDFQAEAATPTGLHVEIAKLNPSTGLYDTFYTGSSVAVQHYSLGWGYYRHSTTTGTMGPAPFEAQLNPGETFKYTIVAEGTATGAAMDLDNVKLMGCLLPCPTVTISPASLTAGQVDVAYSQSLAATGGIAPYAWAISSGTLPTGLTLSAAGVLSGTITGVPGVFNFVVRATDDYGCVSTKSYALTVNCPTVNVSGTPSPTATQTLVYATQTLTASGGMAPYVWSVPAGTLPAGLLLNSGVTATTATITGIPTTVQSRTFTIRATDVNGCFKDTSYTITVSSPPMSIGNLVWNDVNNNGVKDAAELGISGLTVQLFSPGADNAIGGTGSNADVQVGANVTTSVTGGYAFTGLSPAKYYVKVTPSVSYPLTSGTPVTQDNGVNNDNNGAQPGGLSTALFSPVIDLTAGTESMTDGDTDYNTDYSVDFGLFTGMLVGDLVFSDVNNNGIKDGTEPGISGVTVELLNGGTNAVIASTTTNANGGYGFTVYTAGSYKVRVTPNAANRLASAAAPGTDNATNDNNDGTQPGGQGTPSTSFAFTLTPGGEPGTSGATNTENTIDFGFAPTVGIGNLVFKDVNNNGFYDALNDTVVNGVTLNLFTAGSDPLTATPVATTSTAGGGLYAFYVVQGSYFVFVPPNQFQAGGPLENTRPSLEPTGVQSIDDNGDQNALATPKEAITGVMTGAFTLTVNGAPTTATGETGFNSTSDNADDANSDLTIDLGFFPTGTPGFPLAGRVRRDLPGLGDPSASVAPLPGVEVALYQDVNASGSLEFEEMAAVETVMTDSTGAFSFAKQPAGDYLVVQTVLPGSLATYDSDGGDPATTSIKVTAAAIKGIEFLQAVTPDTFELWRAQHALGGNNSAGDNPDGDMSGNLLEYALGTDPDNGTPQRRFWLEEAVDGGIDAVLVRPTTGHLDVQYGIEGSADLVSWDAELVTPVVSQNNDGTETVRFAGVVSPFVRLKVSLDADHDGTAEETAVSQAQGWHREVFQAGQQTFSMPLLRDEIFAGVAPAVNGNVLTGVAPHLTAGCKYYVEVIGGALEGQRFEVNASEPASPGLTLASAPPPGLAGARIAVRPHWSLGTLFPADAFHAGTSSKAADRVLSFDAARQAYRIFWLYAAPSGSRWVREGDASLADAGTITVGPADAVIVQARSGAVATLHIGQVREWNFAVSLIQGSQLVGGGYPVAQSPADRGMTQGFTAVADASNSDRIQFWRGDAVPGATGYDSVHAQAAGPAVVWTVNGSDDVTNSKLLTAFRGVFILSTQFRSEWIQYEPNKQ